MSEDRIVKTSLVLCALVVVHTAAYFMRSIVAPVTFAIFVVAVIWPIRESLGRRMPGMLAFAVTLLGTLAVVSVLSFLVVWALGLVAQWLISNTARFQELYAHGVDWLEGHGVAVNALIATNFGPGWISGAVRRIGGQGYGLVSFLIVVFAFTVLGLLEVDVISRNIEKLDSEPFRRHLLAPAREICAKYRRYMAVRTQMSLLTGAVVWAFALIAGLELATAWGVLAFVLNYIPFIGPLFATVFPSLFALAQFESPGLAILVFACLNAIQFFIGSYLEPRIAGAQLSMSPFMVLFAVFFWSALWGVAGAFIGVPILIAILTVCSDHDSSRWLSTLMSGGDKKSA
jgi:AI-2 transport protein TqsA